MSYYGGTITVAGRNLITGLVAGETIEFTRILVGSGAMPEDVEPIDMTALVTPVAEGTSTIPTVEGGEMRLTVEYRNDMNGGLKEGFWLREFGIFAKTDKTEEILLYYATLGDSPQPVNAYQDNRIDIRRYPVTIALVLDPDVQITYNPGAFVTASEAYDLIDTMVSYAVDNISATVTAKIVIPADGWEPREISGDGGYPLYIDVPCEKASDNHFPCFALAKGSIPTAKSFGLCPTIQAMDGVLRFWAKTKPDKDMTGTVSLFYSDETGKAKGMRTNVITDFTIPAEGWQSGDEDSAEDYPLYADAVCEDATPAHFPSVALDVESLDAAGNAELCPTVQSLGGKIRFWAKNRPDSDITGTVVLVYITGKTAYAVSPGTSGSGQQVIPIASSTAIGGVRVQEGSGLTIDDSGNISLDTAANEEVAEIFNGSGVPTA